MVMFGWTFFSIVPLEDVGRPLLEEDEEVGRFLEGGKTQEEET